MKAVLCSVKSEDHPWLLLFYVPFLLLWQSCLQRLQNIPWRAKPSLVEKHCSSALTESHVQRTDKEPEAYRGYISHASWGQWEVQSAPTQLSISYWSSALCFPLSFYLWFSQRYLWVIFFNWRKISRKEHSFRGFESNSWKDGGFMLLRSQKFRSVENSELICFRKCYGGRVSPWKQHLTAPGSFRVKKECAESFLNCLCAMFPLNLSS